MIIAQLTPRMEIGEISKKYQMSTNAETFLNGILELNSILFIALQTVPYKSEMYRLCLSLYFNYIPVTLFQSLSEF